MSNATVAERTVKRFFDAVLSADSQLATLAPGGVHPQSSPGKDLWPVVVWGFQSGLVIAPAGDQVIATDGRYLIKAMDKSRSFTRVWDVGQRLLDLLQGATYDPQDGSYVFQSRYLAPWEWLETTEDGTQFTHYGGFYQIIAR